MKKILKIIFSLILVVSLVACGGSDKPKLIWPDSDLAKLLPKPDFEYGEVTEDDEENLTIKISDIDEDDYSEYIKKCQSKGFKVNKFKNSIYYSAFNDERTKLVLSFDEDDEMEISLERLKFSNIEWPNSKCAKQLPKPKSNIGKILWEDDTGLAIYLGNTTDNDYKDYIKACIKKGFTIDYNKGDTWYYADNKDGYDLTLKYGEDGKNVIFIRLDAPKTSEKKDDTTTSGVSKKFKETMDTYEEFFDEYIKFMKKYNDSSDPSSMLKDYTNYMKKYTETMKKFEDLEDDLSDEELEYYLEVQTRISQKLLEVSS